ncbi:MAG: cytochrome d ubiquinol oxidase subunit II [Nitrospirae bacterium]|nr:cytochrome d ubiquinol oxidase subunit II [Nitrospirota bacterium]
MELNTLWFLILTFFITVYTILDGFDLGVGILHLFARNNDERRININAIGPVWDGNEVWLLAVWGTLFAVFPPVYATLLTAFYSIVMLLLVALIFRAVSIKFREVVLSRDTSSPLKQVQGRLSPSPPANHPPHPPINTSGASFIPPPLVGGGYGGGWGEGENKRWQRFWDWSFGIGSLIPPFLFGLITGNILQGIPISSDGRFTGHTHSLLNPYSSLTGLLGIAMFAMHGAAYMTLKTEGEILERMRRSLYISWTVFVVLYLSAISITPSVSPFLFEGLLSNPLFWLISLLLFAATIYIPMAVRRRRFLSLFLSSSTIIASTAGLIGLSLFPRLAPSSIDLAYSLTTNNTASPAQTLTIMLIITLITLPVIITYTVYVYRVFKGKVKFSGEGY